MKHLKILLLVLILSVYSFAEEVYPWKSFTIEPEIGVSGNLYFPEGRGGGLYTSLSLKDLIRNTRFGLTTGYNYFNDDSESKPFPYASFQVGHRYKINHFYSLWPTIGFNVLLPTSDSSISIENTFTIGASFDIRLYERNFLALKPMLILSQIEMSPHFCLSVGIKHEVPVLRKMPEPKVEMDLNAALITPDGDSNNDSLVIRHKIKKPSSFEHWYIRIIDSEGNVLKSWKDNGNPPDRVEWYPMENDGSAILSGSGLIAETLWTDLLGNEYGIRKGFSIAIPPPSVTLTLSHDTIIPTGSNLITITADSQNRNSIENWSISISSEAVGEIQSWSGEGSPPSELIWNMQKTDGNLLKAPGKYLCKIEYTDLLGNLQTDTDEFEIFLPEARMDLIVEPYTLSSGIQFSKDLIMTIRTENPESFSRWAIKISDSSSALYRSWSGEGVPPAQIIWSRTETAHKLADLPMGEQFSVILEAEDIQGTKLFREGKFIRAIPNANISLYVEPKLFSPDNDGFNDLLGIYCSMDNSDSIKSWVIRILDEKSNVLFFRTNEGPPPAKSFWNGRNMQGVLVPSASDFKVILETIDILGRTLVSEEQFSTDIFLYEDNGKKKIRVPGILFPPNSADFSLLSEDERDQNSVIMSRIATTLKKFPDYKILIEGHGNIINWKNAEQAAWEQQQELVPLSKERAQAVKDFLIREGVAEERLYILGSGGAYPLVPFSNSNGRWINRRVEFILLK